MLVGRLEMFSALILFYPRFGEIEDGDFMDRSYRMFPNLPSDQRGEVRCLQVDSELLRDNPWGIPIAETFGCIFHQDTREVRLIRW